MLSQASAGEAMYDRDFDLSAREAQLYALKACDEALRQQAGATNVVCPLTAFHLHEQAEVRKLSFAVCLLFMKWRCWSQAEADESFQLVTVAGHVL